MLITQWNLEIADIIMYKIVSFGNISVIKKNCANFLPPPPSQKRSYGLVFAGECSFTDHLPVEYDAT